MSNDSNDPLKPQGHAIGFIDTPSACEGFVQALIQAGLPHSKILVLQGADGIHQWEQIMGGSLWGESAEDEFKNGIAELEAGHSVVAIEVLDSEEAARVGDISQRYGGHGFYHFGILTDTRLTA